MSAAPLLSLALLALAADPPPLAVRDVRLAPERDAPRVTLLVRHGVLEAIEDATQPVPPGRRVLEGAGRLVLPAFVDAFTQAGLSAPEPARDADRPPDPRSDPWIEARAAARKGVHAARRVAEVVALDDATRATWREAGFGALCVSPSGELLGGTSALVSARDLAARDALIVPLVAQHAAFDARGPGYPSTLIGYHAQLRQAFLDARHQAELERRREQGRPGPRPAWDPSLRAIGELLAAGRWVCEAQRSEDAERWMALSDEHGLELSLVGGRDLWEIAPRLSERSHAVVLTLEWSDEVVDPDAGAEEVAEDDPDESARWTYREPLRLRRERRRLWEEERDCALRLAEADVPLAFGTAGGEPERLLERVRELVAAGLPREDALEALTRGGARHCGVEERLGALEPGMDASFVLWSDDPLLEREAEVAWAVLEGEVYEGRSLRAERDPPPSPGVDAGGRWELELAGEGLRSALLTLVAESDGRVHGTLELQEPGARTAPRGELEGRLRADRLELEGRLPIGGFVSELTLRARVRGDELEGELEWRWSEGRDATSFGGRRAPERERREGAR